MTIHDRLLAALIAQGGRVSTSYSPTKKYTVVLLVHQDGKEHVLWLGKSGALRVGKSIAGSIPAENFKRRLLAEAV